jgi:hypothetical protein
MTDVEDPAATIKGIAKIDLRAPEGTDEAAVGRIEYPRGMTGGEAWFQPRFEDDSKSAGKGCVRAIECVCFLWRFRVIYTGVW